MHMMEGWDGRADQNNFLGEWHLNANTLCNITLPELLCQLLTDIVSHRAWRSTQQQCAKFGWTWARQLVALARLQGRLRQEPKLGLHRPICGHGCMLECHLPHNATAAAFNVISCHTSKGGMLQCARHQGIIRQLLNDKQ